jgi:hypothetical protein
MRQTVINIVEKLNTLYVQCAFSESLALLEVIRQTGCYEYVFELSRSTNNYGLQNTIAVSIKKIKSLLNLD